MSKFTHRDHEITLDKFGEFTVTIAGKKERAPSLDAAKKRVDKALAVVFVPIKCIREPGRWTDEGEKDADGLVSFTVVNVFEDKRNRYGYRYKFLEEKGGDGHRKIIRDTAENRAKLKAIIAHKAETDRIEEERKEELADMEMALPEIEAAEFLGKK